MPQIIIDDAVPYAQEIFGHLGEVRLVPGREITAATVKNAQALIVRSRTQVNQQLLEDSSVKFVGSTVVGLDHLDQDYLAEQNTHLYTAQGCNARSVAQFVITALFQLAQEQGFNLQEKTLGIIGVGNVGRLVKDYAKKLNIKVLLNDPPRKDAEKLAEFIELDELVQNSDIITLHTPLTPLPPYPTSNLISSDKLKLIKDNAIIINAARGGIIDETSWASKITQANIIDCWDNEPFINENLYKTAHWATPHIAGHSFEAKLNGSLMVYKELCKFLDTPELATYEKDLPPLPACLISPTTNAWQEAITEVLVQAYDLNNDHQAISGATLDITHNKFEDYRRNYPIRREWQMHSLPKTHNSAIDSTLAQLGFNLMP